MNTYEDMYKSICRVCLTRSKCGSMVSLFDKTSGDGLSPYGKSVITFANVLLKPDDKFPTMMCINCVLLLKQAIRFKFTCENSDIRLKNLMKIKQSTETDYCELLCQYTLFNYYLPEESLENSPEILNKTKSPIKPIHCDYKVTEVINTLPKVNEDKEGANNNKKYYEDTTKTRLIINLDDFHIDSDANSEESGKDLEDQILDNIEKNINLSTDISGPLHSYKYVKPKGNKQKKFIPKKDVKLFPNFNCNVCGKVFNNYITYSRHINRHNGRTFMCESCAKSFFTKAELNVHQVACHGIGTHLKCSHCPYKTAQKIKLIEHIRLHTGERPYTCDKCGLTFRRRAIWRNHLVYHTEKNFQCLQCPKKFYRHCAMLAHMNNIHDRLYVYMCNKCGATYTKPVTVRRHLIDKHGVPRELQGKIIRVKKNECSELSLK